MKRMSTKRMWREAGASYLFLSPTLFVLLLFIIGPIWFAIFLAFHKVQLLGMTLSAIVGHDIAARSSSSGGSGHFRLHGFVERFHAPTHYFVRSTAVYAAAWPQ
ncbi:hypothetical protein GHH_c08750 [Geobacillus sp. GHH01]|nr:hypothetical protein GHH_c08750 [Geobacillus sp. GHH01]